MMDLIEKTKLTYDLYGAMGNGEVVLWEGSDMYAFALWYLKKNGYEGEDCPARYSVTERGLEFTVAVIDKGFKEPFMSLNTAYDELAEKYSLSRSSVRYSIQSSLKVANATRISRGLEPWPEDLQSFFVAISKEIQEYLRKHR